MSGRMEREGACIVTARLDPLQALFVGGAYAVWHVLAMRTQRHITCHADAHRAAYALLCAHKKRASPKGLTPSLHGYAEFSACALQAASQALQAALQQVAAAIARSKGQGRARHQQDARREFKNTVFHRGFQKMRRKRGRRKPLKFNPAGSRWAQPGRWAQRRGVEARTPPGRHIPQRGL